MIGKSGKHRKAYQLSKQVHRVISGVIGGVCGDEEIQALTVWSVKPLGNTAHLVVTLSLAKGQEDPPAIMQKLEGVRGIVRREIALAITRRRVPEISFRLVPHWGDEISHSQSKETVR
jgi:ribosome-binding factor A